VRSAVTAGEPNTRRGALVALEQLRAEARSGTVPSRQSLGEYLRRWLADTAAPSISANTRRGYEDAIAHFEPIADVPLRELTAEHIEAACSRMATRRGMTASPASPKTVRNAQLMLRRALSIAEQRGHVTRNVARQVPLRRVPQAEVDALTAPRARAILAAVAGDRYEAAFALAMVGLRASEILGLAWDDVDLDSATVRVRYQLVGSGRTAARAQLKTRASRATMPLPAFVVERLRAHLEAQRSERPVAPIDGGLVFVTPAGLAVNGSWLTKHFQALLADAGLQRMRLHDLRHGAATLLVGAGVHPRVAQQLLRHASSRTTMEVYSHVSGAQEREAVDVLERVIGG
jgi:integrase